MIADTQLPPIKIGMSDDAWVALSSTGPVALGWPATVAFQMPMASSEIDVVLMDVDSFRKDLAELHRSLKGKADLSSLDGDFGLTVKAVDDLGHLNVSTMVSRRFGEPVEFDIRFDFRIDQSYLPGILSGLDRQFLNGGAS